MTVEVSRQRAFVPVVSSGAVVTRQRIFVPVIDLTQNPGLGGSSRRRQAMIASF